MPRILLTLFLITNSLFVNGNELKFPHHMTDVLFTSDDIEWMIRVPMGKNEIFEDDSRRVGNKA
jgi:hypothetical protein